MLPRLTGRSRDGSVRFQLSRHTDGNRTLKRDNLTSPCSISDSFQQINEHDGSSPVSFLMYSKTRSSCELPDFVVLMTHSIAVETRKREPPISVFSINDIILKVVVKNNPILPENRIKNYRSRMPRTSEKLLRASSTLPSFRRESPLMKPVRTSLISI
jgi:hypothetical protein